MFIEIAERNKDCQVLMERAFLHKKVSRTKESAAARLAVNMPMMQIKTGITDISICSVTCADIGDDDEYVIVKLVLDHNTLNLFAQDLLNDTMFKSSIRLKLDKIEYIRDPYYWNILDDGTNYTTLSLAINIKELLAW
jgi:hypothetical protein